MSGNGVQIWLPCRGIDITSANRNVVIANARALEDEVRRHLASFAVKVDSVSDLGRIAKVPGTISRKGIPAKDRPHRLARVLSGWQRQDSEALRELLLATPRTPTPRRTKSRPKATATVEVAAAEWPALEVPPTPDTTAPAVTPARRRADGSIDTDAPAAMCAPMRQLAATGLSDRSDGIFLQVLMLAAKGLSREEIVEIVLAWDAAQGQKLVDRADRVQYVEHALDKIHSGTPDGESIAPPCKKLQAVGYCPVDRQHIPCEVVYPVTDIAAALGRIPSNVDAPTLRYRLEPIFDAVAALSESDRERAQATIVRDGRVDANNARTLLVEACDRVKHDLVARKHLPVVSGDLWPAEAAGTGEPVKGQIIFPFLGSVRERGNYYVPNSDEPSAAISNFVFRAVRVVQGEQGATLYLDAVTAGGIVRGLEIPHLAFRSRRDLQAHLHSPKLQFTGSDLECQGVLALIMAQRPPEVNGVSALGIHEVDGRWMFVHGNGAIDHAGVVKDPPVTVVGRRGEFDRHLHIEFAADASSEAALADVLRALVRINTPVVIVPVLGWTFAAMAKPIITRLLKAFPYLLVTGSAGCGKTSLIREVVLRLFGLDGADVHTAGMTEFTLVVAVSATNNIALVLDEYKPSEMNDRALSVLHRILKSAYMGSVVQRGQRDQIVRDYDVVAPIILAGERIPDDPALMERCIAVQPEKRSVEDARYQAAFSALTAMNLLPVFAEFVRFALGRGIAADVERARARVTAFVGERSLPPRIVTNLVVMATGCELFERFCEACGVDDAESLDVEAACADVVKLALGGAGDHAQTALDRFIEALPVLVTQRRIVRGEHYDVVGNELLLNIESAFSVYQEHLRRTGEARDVPDLRTIRRYIAEYREAGRYVLPDSADNRIRMTGGRRVRVVRIDLVAASHLASREELVSADAIDGEWLPMPKGLQ